MTIEELVRYQRQIPKIDTHEHIPPEAEAARADTDILDVLLVPYNCDTLWSAGCSEEEWHLLMDKNSNLMDRCTVLFKYLPEIRYTAFFRAALATLEILFGEKELTCDSLSRANDRLVWLRANRDYASLLGSMNIQRVMSCSSYDCLDKYTDPLVQFVPTVSEILPRNGSDVKKLEKVSGIRIHDLESMLVAVSALFEKYHKIGIAMVKFGSAYRRILSFGPLDYQSAHKQLEKILSFTLMGDQKNNGSVESTYPYEELMALDDYLTDHMLRLCENYGMSVIFHTAMHAWNENDPERAHVHYLTRLIRRFRDVKFILLHTGAPFFEEAVLLSRYYANVYLDLTWFHIISPSLVQQAIRRIIELVPTNKVFAFGGDYCSVYTIPGHLEFAMRNIAGVFSELIQEGTINDEEAKRILRQWYLENPKRIFLI